MDQEHPQKMKMKNEPWNIWTEWSYQQQLTNLEAIQQYKQLLTLSRNRSRMTHCSWLLWIIDNSGQLKMKNTWTQQGIDWLWKKKNKCNNTMQRYNWANIHSSFEAKILKSLCYNLLERTQVHHHSVKWITRTIY